MNSAEASRVLAVVDESLEGLRLLSFVTAEVLDTAEQLKDLLGEDMVNTLVKHRSLLLSSKANLGNDGMLSSTLELLRLLKKTQAGHRLQALHTERTPGMMQVLNFMERLRGQAQKRLTTTVEEDASNREYYEEVKAREEKAVSEKIQLEQKLKLQRVELARRANAVQVAEDKSRAEIHSVTTITTNQQTGIKSEATNTRENDTGSYVGDDANLNMELTAARNSLAALRAEHRDIEAGLRKGKKRAAQDVESVIGEYDTDVGAKEQEYQTAQNEYRETLRQLEEYRAQTADMQAIRLAAEAEEKRVAGEQLQKALRSVRENRAARAIQGMWKTYKAKKKDAEKKKKKAAEKKKGKK